ncbi:MAG TPA: potassium-transporting ATPase subunit KdpA [Symbiobacteriaceae bacterium]|nr:potassium-transporting ATPase subunit KdpA [Symbiobacteriaceae bacterium]
MVAQVAVTLLLALVLVIPTGHYLYRVFGGGPAPLDGLFRPIERLVFRLIGLNDPEENMSWKAWGTALLLSNAVMLLLAYVIFRVQGVLPWNPDGIKGMDPTLAFNTAISFMTNTNLQHYSGETGLSYFSQMAAITFLMFTSAGAGFTVAVAFIRGLAGCGLGNYWADMTRLTLRVLLPASLLVALVLVWQGSPQTLAPAAQVTTLEGAAQTIPLGPVASLESIKHIGTNGGGFFGANAAHPFENPNPLTNLIHILGMLWLPTSLVYMFGLFIKNRKQSWIFFGAASLLFVMLLGSIFYFEAQGNPALHAAGLAGPSLEGKEVRFGMAQSALFTTVTTAATTGSVNNMHDSLTPMGGFTPLVLMMLNSVFGGKGVGFMNLVAMAMIAVFLVGLMVGRTPEFLAKKLETREITLLAIVILLHPLIILAPTAVSLLTEAGRSAISHPGFHGLSQALYEFTSSGANNGSGFEGLGDNSVFWNAVTGVVMFLGRYPSMIALLAVSGLLAAKKPVPAGPGTLRTDTALFGAVLVGVIIIVGALTFFPALALGPIADHLTLMAGK